MITAVGSNKDTHMACVILLTPFAALSHGFFADMPCEKLFIMDTVTVSYESVVIYEE